MAGCATSDREVSDMMVRLRQMSGVRGVDLASATEDESSEPVAGAPADCRTAFDVTVSFAPPPGAAAAGVSVAAPAPAAEGAATPAEPSSEGGDQ